MRLVVLGALFLSALASPLFAQFERPPAIRPHAHPYIDRVEYFSFRGALLGGAAGALTGAVGPRVRDSHALPIYTNGLAGAGLGILSGALMAGVSNFRAPEPRPERDGIFVRHVRDAARYGMVGADFGIGAGTVWAMTYHRDQHDVGHFLEQVFTVLSGMCVGITVGIVTYFVQHP